MDEAFMRGYYAAYNSEDEGRLAAYLAEDVVLTSAQSEQRGRDAYLATYRFITASFRDQMTPDDIVIAGDRATVKITDRFVAKCDVPDFLGRAFAKGDSFTLTLSGDYTVKDGKIATIAITMLGMGSPA